MATGTTRAYTQLAEIVDEVGLGLLDLGIQAGERVCILSNTRPDWSYADMGATSTGAIVVPIYQTNSPEECLWVISDSGASAIFVEDEQQLAKIVEIRDQIPNIRSVIIFDPPAGASTNGSGAEALPLDAITLEQLRERGRGRPVEELEARRAGVRPDDPFTFIYTSGTTGPPKGCVLTHGNYRAMIKSVEEGGGVQSEEVCYLYLPLAHSYALLIQLLTFDLGGTLAYFGGDTKQIVPELLEVKPSYLPSVPRVFEKIYTLAHGAIEAKPPAEREQAEQAIKLGMKVRMMMLRGEEVPDRTSARPSRRPTRSCSKTCARSSAATCARPPAERPRSRGRSSSSSSPAGCRCSRATG